jgi:hypothetical protein
MPVMGDNRPSSSSSSSSNSSSELVRFPSSLRTQALSSVLVVGDAAQTNPNPPAGPLDSGAMMAPAPAPALPSPRAAPSPRARPAFQRSKTLPQRLHTVSEAAAPAPAPSVDVAASAAQPLRSALRVSLADSSRERSTSWLTLTANGLSPAGHISVPFPFHAAAPGGAPSGGQTQQVTRPGSNRSRSQSRSHGHGPGLHSQSMTWSPQLGAQTHIAGNPALVPPAMLPIALHSPRAASLLASRHLCHTPSSAVDSAPPSLNRAFSQNNIKRKQGAHITSRGSGGGGGSSSSSGRCFHWSRRVARCCCSQWSVARAFTLLTMLVLFAVVLVMWSTMNRTTLNVRRDLAQTERVSLLNSAVSKVRLPHRNNAAAHAPPRSIAM